MVSDKLKRLPVNNAFGSRDIAQAILDCLREINEQEQDYTVSRLIFTDMVYRSTSCAGTLPDANRMQYARSPRTVAPVYSTGNGFRKRCDRS